MSARRLVVVLALAGATAACTADRADETPAPDERVRRVVLLDGGDQQLLGLGSVAVSAAAGDDLVIRNANRARGDTSGYGHTLLASPAGAAPPLFRPVVGGAAPNGAVWGACRGGVARQGQVDCPVPPVAGPPRWDGEQYWSLGDLLPGEERVLPLADLLPPGDYDLWCGKHPALRLELTIGEGPHDDEFAAASPAGAVSAAQDGGTVLVAPDVAAPAAELLAFAPRVVAVPVGGSVTWRVDGPAPHSVELGGGNVSLLDSAPSTALPDVPAGGRWDGTTPVRSGWMGTDASAPGGASFSLTFTAPGRYRYVCRFHPAMDGEVVVG